EVRTEGDRGWRIFSFWWQEKRAEFRTSDICTGNCAYAGNPVTTACNAAAYGSTNACGQISGRWIADDVAGYG
ncbi:hypothetical protein, partial [Waltera sp.]|uniref:hypothetical protein n=1 Tax=Waltera sp. TaxID=2815806 RepID=UPI003AB942D1